MTQRPASAAAHHLLTPYLAPVYSLCFRLLGNADWAEDAAQETFLAAVRMWGQFSPPAQSATGRDPRLQWLLAIAARRALQVRRQNSRTTATLESIMEPEHTPSPSAAAEQAETFAQLENALRDLPDDQRELVILHHVSGLSQAEIAATYNLPPRTVSHRISDGVAALRRRLVREGAEGRDGRDGRIGLASTVVLLAQLPSMTPPASLSATLFSHPAVLAWSSSVASGATPVATASTATVGGAGASTPAVLSTSAKGVTLMSSKFTVAALAAAAIVLAVVWFWQDPTRPPATPTAQPLASAPAGSAAADSARLASPTATPAATDAHLQVAPPTSAETIAALQTAYSEALTAEQRVRRERVQQAFPKLPPTVVVLPENASHNFRVFAVNTSVVFLNLGRREWTEGEGQQLRFDAWCPDPVPAPADADTQPEVGVSSGTTSSNDLMSASHDAWRVTTCGCSSNVSLIDGKIEAVPLTTDQQLGYIDLFNARQPAQYEADAILRQIGLAGIAPATWEPLLADAREADAALLTAVDAFRDPTHRAESGPMMWRAGERLRAAQADISKEVSKALRKDPSGTSGYALFMARRIDEKNLLGSTQRVTVKLIIKGECLAQVARLIAENPLAGGTLQVDIQAADLLLDGEYSSTSLADLLAQVATAAKVECVREASGRFLLRPAAPPDEAGAGF